MGERIMGTYEGEGPSVTGTLKTPANVPDVPFASPNTSSTGQGTTTGISVDIRRRIRTSSEPARSAITINYSGGDQVFTKCTRAILITTAGNLAVRFADDATDTPLPGLILGQVYSFSVAIIRQTGSTAAGVALF